MSNYIHQLETLKILILIIRDVIGEGNCLFRVIAQFIYGNEFMYNNIRQSIYNEVINRIRVIPNVIIETERENLCMHHYTNTNKVDGTNGGDIEISLAYEIYNINIGEYIEIRDENNGLNNLRFVKY